MIVHAASIDDVPAVVDLWSREGGPTRLRGADTEALALIAWDPEALLVARLEDRIVGTLIVGWDGWRCHMYRLVVEPFARRTGVARRLVAEARRLAAIRGAKRIDAIVDVANADAITFWASVGFELDAHAGRWSLLL